MYFVGFRLLLPVSENDVMHWFKHVAIYSPSSPTPQSQVPPRIRCDVLLSAAERCSRGQVSLAPSWQKRPQTILQAGNLGKHSRSPGCPYIFLLKK